MFNPLHLFIFILLLNSIFQVQSQTDCPNRRTTVQNSFRQNGIFRDLKLDDRSLQFVEVEYITKNVICGNNFSIIETSLQPEVDIDFGNGLFTLIMVDLDALTPANPSQSPFVHWLVINISGDKTTTGDTVKSYLPTTPTPLFGAHRFVFLVFSQSRRISTSAYSNSDRARFSVSSFSRLNNLRLVAGNFFYEAVLSFTRFIADALFQ